MVCFHTLVDSEVLYEARRRFQRNKDPEKEQINCVLKLCNWLANSKLPSRSNWTGQRGNARKLKDDDFHGVILSTAEGMMIGTYWRKELSGWREFVACMIALRHMFKHAPLNCMVRDILSACKEEKRKMYDSLLKREVELWSAQKDAGPMPTLELIMRRKSLDYGEAKWDSICEYILDASELNGPNKIVLQALAALKICVDTEESPSQVLDVLKFMKTPPGYMSREAIKEAERLQRAKDAEDDDDWFDKSEEEVSAAAPQEKGDYSRSFQDRLLASSTPSPVLEVGPPPQTERAKRSREEAFPEVDDPVGEEESERILREKYNKLAGLRQNIMSLIETYGAMLHAIEYAGPRKSRNLGYAYKDVNPCPLANPDHD